MIIHTEGSAEIEISDIISLNNQMSYFGMFRLIVDRNRIWLPYENVDMTSLFLILALHFI